MSLSALRNSVFYSMAASVCFRQQLRMKLGYCCPQRHLQSLYHIPKCGGNLEPLDRWTWV